jgi:hypothetical protein
MIAPPSTWSGVMRSPSTAALSAAVSNHPPAEPGALRYEPLKAASGSLRGPDR